MSETQVGIRCCSKPRQPPPSIAAGIEGVARLLIEPEARCWAPGELGERRFWREAQEVFGGSGRPFLSSISFGRTKEMDPRVQVAEPPAISF